VSIEGVELVDESFIDFRALPARVEVLECFEDVPLVSAWGVSYLIMK
jgi:hypothetical protein